MSGLPEGVTIEVEPTDDSSYTEFVTCARQYLGMMWWSHIPETPWYAETKTAQWKRHRSHDAAVRWLMLQARPIVYRVRQERDAGAWFRWAVRDDRGQALDFYPDQVHACQMADALAHQAHAHRKAQP